MNYNDKQEAKRIYEKGINRYRLKDLSVSVLFALKDLALEKGDDSELEIVQQRIKEIIN